MRRRRNITITTLTNMTTSTDVAPSTPSEDTGAHAALGSPQLLRLLQLSSSLCPIGAFAYSQGLESAVEQGWVRSETELSSWLDGIGTQALAQLDLPLLARAHAAWKRGDPDAARSIGQRLASNRESRELQEQDQQLGLSLARVLVNLGVEGAGAFVAHGERGRVSYVTAYALGAVHFAIPAEAAAHGFAFTWAEQQVSAAARLIPLGHMAAQRALSDVLVRVPTWVEIALEVPDEEIGSSTPGLSMASAWHETQYTRLFRS
jgi:urease accessory protein